MRDLVRQGREVGLCGSYCVYISTATITWLINAERHIKTKRQMKRNSVNTGMKRNVVSTEMWLLFCVNILIFFNQVDVAIS